MNKYDVLHRDISQNNILLGPKDARVGERGKLVDFDMAFLGPRPLAQTPEDQKAVCPTPYRCFKSTTDALQGTPFYMSVSMLTAQRGQLPLMPFHDQLDDLESFYYVLYDTMFSWAGVGTRVDDRPSHYRLWATERETERQVFKRGHFEDVPNIDRLSPFWTPPTLELLLSFNSMIKGLVIEKKIVSDLSRPNYVKRYTSLLARADKFYEEVLSMFDRAIHALEKEESDFAPPRSPRAEIDISRSCAPFSHSPPNDRQKKRPSPPPSSSIAPNDQAAVDDRLHVAQKCPDTTSLGDLLRLIPQRPDNGEDLPRTPDRPTRVAVVDVVPTETLPRTRKRRAPKDFEVEHGATTKRGRSVKPLPPRSRKPAWVRTSPHRTRAWVKANPHLNPAQ